MKKTKIYYLIIWAILLAVFNVIAFVSPGWIGSEKYTTTFWIGYIYIMISFVANLFLSMNGLNANTKEKMFLRFPLIIIAYASLITSFVTGGFIIFFSSLPNLNGEENLQSDKGMFANGIPYWIAILISVVVFSLYIISYAKAMAAAQIVENKDKSIQDKQRFIKNLTIKANVLISSPLKDEKFVSAVREVYEAFRYSDPISSDDTLDIERKIDYSYELFEKALMEGDLILVEEHRDSLLSLIRNRNEICKNNK